MSDHTRDEIAIIVLRALEEIDGLTCAEGLALADDIADAVLALLASKREAEPWGPSDVERAVRRAQRGNIDHRGAAIPHPQTAEPDAWRATTTGSQPKEGDDQ